MSVFAFRVDGRLYEPNVMSFGSKNAPILRGLTWKQCLVYIDDILVFANDFEEHCKRLDAVLCRIESADLKLKPTKCEFGMSEVNYLRFQISNKGLSASKRKAELLLATEPPKVTRVSFLDSFMCSINYYRTLIPCYAKLTAGLLVASYSKTKFVTWNEAT